VIKGSRQGLPGITWDVEISWAIIGLAIADGTLSARFPLCSVSKARNSGWSCAHAHWKLTMIVLAQRRILARRDIQIDAVFIADRH
jgi:hypothetical protein